MLTHGQDSSRPSRSARRAGLLLRPERKVPLHVERGFDATDTTVTVFGAEGPHNVNDYRSSTAGARLMALADTAATPGSNIAYLGDDRW